MKLNLKIVAISCALVFACTNVMSADNDPQGGEVAQMDQQQHDQGQGNNNNGNGQQPQQDQQNNNSGGGGQNSNPQEAAVKEKGKQVLQGAQNKALGMFDNLMGSMQNAIGGSSGAAAPAAAN